MKNLLFAFCLLISTALSAQRQVSGTIRNRQTGMGIPAVSVTVKGSSEGTYSNDKGNFSVYTRSKMPIVLIFSAIGYAMVEKTYTAESKQVTVEMEPASTMGEEVVVSASRSIQKKLESPVTIERISSSEIINSPQPNYFDMIQGLKGVDVTTSSFIFTTITTRGFNTSGNSNFTQIVDGMDNQAPGLNFSLGSVIGLSQLDVDNIELLSGASSALYGSRGLNGALISTGKDPFKYQGLSFQITQGVSHIKKGVANDPLGPSPVYDWAVRWGKKVNEHLAFKMNFQYTQAKDWVASDTTNTRGPGNSYTDPNYNGVNLYGGATSVDINPFLMGALQYDPSLAPIIEPLLQQSNPVARTGYAEYGYLSSDARLFKANAEIRYKITDKLEAIGSGTFGMGDAVYSNDTRYQLKGFQLGQYRLELKSKNWFIRGYTTRENSGKTVVAGYTAQLVNEAWKPSYDPTSGDGWYPQYTGALIYGLATGASYNDASYAARQFADQGRPAPGSDRLYKMRDSISGYPSNLGGTQFLDRSKLYNLEGQYNFSSLVKVVDLIGGLNYRVYSLNSKGTLFPDTDGPISVKEYSAYVQASKKLIDNRLTIGASFRWDKNSLFEKAQVTSRLSAVFEAARNNFIRFSYQNAYSFPNNIQTLQSTLQGASPLYYASGGSSYLLNDVYQFSRYPAYTYKSVQEFQASGDAGSLQKINLQDIKPQSVNAFELGYSSLIGKRVLLDLLGYFSTWKNFIGYTNVANTPGTTDVNAFNDPNAYAIYNISYNNSYTVNTYGYAIGIAADLSRNFMAKANFTSDYFQNKDSSQVNNFNTPNFKINFEFGNSGFGPRKRYSFGTTLRYRPAYFYQIGFASGTVAASAVLDAQISYKLFKARSSVKLGGTNLTNKYYRNGFGSPAIGGMYYITFAYNVF